MQPGKEERKTVSFNPRNKEQTSKNEKDKNQRIRFFEYLQDYISLFTENEDTTVRSLIRYETLFLHSTFPWFRFPLFQ